MGAALTAVALSVVACEGSQHGPPTFTGGTGSGTGSATTSASASSSSGGAVCKEVASEVDTRIAALCDALTPMGDCTDVDPSCPLRDDEAAFAAAVDCLCELEILVTCSENVPFTCQGDDFEIAQQCSASEFEYLKCSKIPGNSCSESGSNGSCEVECEGPPWGASCSGGMCSCTVGAHLGETFAGNCGLGWANFAADICAAP